MREERKWLHTRELIVAMVNPHLEKKNQLSGRKLRPTIFDLLQDEERGQQPVEEFTDKDAEFFAQFFKSKKG